MCSSVYCVLLTMCYLFLLVVAFPGEVRCSITVLCQFIYKWIFNMLAFLLFMSHRFLFSRRKGKHWKAWVKLGLLLVMMPPTSLAGCLHSFYMECSVTKAELWYKTTHFKSTERIVFPGSLINSEYKWIWGMYLWVFLLVYLCI